MDLIETLNGSIERLIQNYEVSKSENEKLKGEMVKIEQIIIAKDDIISNLQAQLEQKSLDLDALINKISAALGQ